MFLLGIIIGKGFSKANQWQFSGCVMINATLHGKSHFFMQKVFTKDQEGMGAYGLQVPIKLAYGPMSISVLAVSSLNASSRQKSWLQA